MNSRRIFFFDWDGTLSIGNRPVSHADRCALKELQKQGHRPVPLYRPCPGLSAPGGVGIRF